MFKLILWIIKLFNTIFSFVTHGLCKHYNFSNSSCLVHEEHDVSFYRPALKTSWRSWPISVKLRFSYVLYIVETSCTSSLIPRLISCSTGLAASIRISRRKPTGPPNRVLATRSSVGARASRLQFTMRVILSGSLCRGVGLLTNTTHPPRLTQAAARWMTRLTRAQKDVSVRWGFTYLVHLLLTISPTGQLVVTRLNTPRPIP